MIRTRSARPSFRVGAVAALAGTALLLAGCATASDAPAGDDAEPSTSAAPELTGTVTVFAAASLTEVFDALAEQFEEENPGVDVVLSYGGSSSLATQITEGAPADVFAAANTSTMTTVVDAGAAAGDPEIFTTNTLEIAVPEGNPAGITGLDDFANGDLAIALCDAAVPCGAASTALFEMAGITPAPDTLEEDVKAVLTKVSLGEADAGLVYKTDVTAAAGGGVEGIEFPEASDVVNDYPIAVLAEAPNPDAAAAWIAFILSPVGQDALAAAGFVAP